MNVDRLKSLKVNDEGFAFDTRTGNTYNLNATGRFVMNNIAAGASQHEVVELLTEHFDVDYQTADRGFELFCNQLERNNLIEMGAVS